MLTEDQLRALNWAGWKITFFDDRIVLDYLSADTDMNFPDEAAADAYIKKITESYLDFYKKKGKVYTLITSFLQVTRKKTPPKPLATAQVIYASYTVWGRCPPP
jgi:hypothetical protein